MKILALELSTGRGSVAWLEGENEPSVHVFANDKKHSGLFFENVERCVRQFGVPKRIVIGLGPGSYAGIRIAIATALGLGKASGATLIGVASICAMDVPISEYIVIGDARRASFFFARVAHRRVVEGPVLYSANDLETKISRTSLPVFVSESLQQFPNATLSHPSARELVMLAHERPEEMTATERIEPIYLREPHITVPKPAVFSSR